MSCESNVAVNLLFHYYKTTTLGFFGRRGHVAVLCLNFLAVDFSTNPLMIMPLAVSFLPLISLPLLPPFAPSPPLPYYLMIRRVIARLKWISKLGLITFFSTDLLFFFFSPFPSPLLHIRCSFLFWGITASVSMIHRFLNRTGAERRPSVCASVRMHKLKKHWRYTFSDVFAGICNMYGQTTACIH